jgi:hypothetical protein
MAELDMCGSTVVSNPATWRCTHGLRPDDVVRGLMEG